MEEKTLSIFIDESGDFGDYQKITPYYIVSMVLHEQAVNINDDINKLDDYVSLLNFKEHNIHIGPLIRRESIYKTYLMEDRQKLFSTFFNFTRKLPVFYISTIVKKAECKDIVDLTSKLSKQLSTVIRENIEYFNRFDNLIIYYDNGQLELTKIITSIFNTLFSNSNVDFRKVSPSDYKLFQVADLVCTLELLNRKSPNFSKSELKFFKSPRQFNKNFYKSLQKKKLPHN